MHDHQLASEVEQVSPPRRHASLTDWLIEGARTMLFLPPRWVRLQSSPAIVLIIIVVTVAMAVLIQRLVIDGPANFAWQGLAGEWAGTVLLVWACYLMRPGQNGPDEKSAPPGTTLFTMLVMQILISTLVFGPIVVMLVRTGQHVVPIFGITQMWAVYLLSTIWVLTAQIIVFYRAGKRSRPVMALAAAVLALASAVPLFVPAANLWHARQAADESDLRKPFILSQEAMENQPVLLTRRLGEIKPQRPGAVDLYALTFAPVSNEDVFRREANMVADVIAQRFDAAGRTMQLINHAESTEQWPWATPLNFRRTIERFASVMDRDEDILFIHLTSHGARNGELAAEFEPMVVDTLKARDLKRWLDESGIKNRVISISACYSGSWIDVLADDNTLVMSASDAEHTSYGCGRLSQLTFFGRAMYDEQLRSKTLSFEQAHAAARPVIRQREDEAGKSDGFSNPQLRAGVAIRSRLAQLQARLQRQ